MSNNTSNSELDRLVGEFCNGTATEPDAERLDSLLQTDERARQFYNDYMFLHAELYAQHASVASADSMVVPVAARERNIVRMSRRHNWMAIAATILFVSAVSSWLTYLAVSSHVATGAASQASRNNFEHGAPVARITATRNCLWQDATDVVGFGSTLYAGQKLCLSAGLIELTFLDGAQVVVEGPAKLDVRAKGVAELHEGRIAAIVPERARGFEIASNGLNVVDLGTEFGMFAERGGETEVHVFRGLVMAHLLDSKGQQFRTVELNTAEAARIRPASSMVAMIPARDDEFVRSLSVASGPHDGLYAYEGFNYPEGPLSEQNGGFGWAGPWFNVESADPDGSTNHVAVGGLEYEGMVPLGNRAVQSMQQNRVRRSLSTSIGGVFDAAGLVENQDAMRLLGRDGTTLYLSFLQQVDKLNDVFYGLELHRSDGNANRVLCLGNGAEECGYGATSNVNVYGPHNFPSLGMETTEANFFVVKITFGIGNRDRVQVFRNPESLVEESQCVSDAELVGNFAFDRIGLGNFHGTKVHEVDEIRVGTTFLAVTGRRSRGPDLLVQPLAMSRGSNLPPVSETQFAVDRHLGAMVSSW